MKTPERNIALAIILSLVTCGIYSIYWFVVLTDEVRQASGENFVSGGVAFLLSIVTCGIYGIYWAYQMGKMLDTAKRNRGYAGGSDNAIVYLILQIFGLQIVNCALIQNELNNMN